VTADLLEVTDLRVDIPVRSGTVHAVGGVSFSLAPGETLGVVGESGSGKTMVAMSVMRLLPPGARIAGGSIKVLGTDITSMREKDVRRIRGRDIGMVFQDPMTSLNPLMTLGSQIAEPVRAHSGASKAEALARAEEVLGLVGMPRPAERLRNYPHELSGGLRQRAMIATALACSPRGNQLLISLFAVALNGPSPIPKITRTTSSMPTVTTRSGVRMARHLR
jgi:peptide/nickel transport system ATP-binding protein